MNESIVKKLFDKHCSDFRIEAQKEVLVENGRVDYEVLFDGKRFAVEAKGTRSDEYSAIGQLLNAKRTYSHVYLLAPISFLKKIWVIFLETNTLKTTGLMTVTSKGLHILKKPDPETYYYKPPVKTSKTQKKSPKKWMFVNEIDIALESHFKNQVFTISDIAKKLNTSMSNAYHRIGRLKAAGMVEKMPYGNNPSVYRFVKSRKLDDAIEL